MADPMVRVDELAENSSPSLNDRLIGIGTSYEYQTLVADVARKIVEDYAGSALGGSSRSIKSALDALNTKIGNVSMQTSATTVTGAIAEHEGDIRGINTKIGSTTMGTTATTVTGAIKEHNDKIGNASMGTTATTLTGAIAEHENDISGINTKVGNVSMGTAASTVTGAVKEHNDKIGNASMGTTATTLTGAIAEHESDISDVHTDITNINNNINDITDSIGDVPMGTTAESITGAIAEHEADIIELSAASVSYTLPEIMGVKNLIPYPHVDTTVETNGIIFTDVGDGTVLANGTATDDVSYTLSNSTTWKPIANGSYTLSGCPSGGSESTYYIAGEFMDGATAKTIVDIGSGATMTFDNDVSIDSSTLSIHIKSGTTVSSLVFSPMFRIANIENDTYEPYHNPDMGDVWDEMDDLDGRVTTHDSAISELNSNLTIRTISSNNYKANSTNFEYVGCSITVPSNRMALVQCIAGFSSGAPNAVALTSNSSTPSNSNTMFYQDFPEGYRTGYSSVALLTQGTFYMWARRNSVPTSTNKHIIRGVIL